MELLKNLPLEEQKRRIAPVLDLPDVEGGEQSQSIIDAYRQTPPPEERDKWHVTWDEDNDEASIVKEQHGYQRCYFKGEGNKRGKAVRNKTDIAWRLPKDEYDRRIMHRGLAASNAELDKLVTTGEPIHVSAPKEEDTE